MVRRGWSAGEIRVSTSTKASMVTWGSRRPRTGATSITVFRIVPHPTQRRIFGAGFSAACLVLLCYMPPRRVPARRLRFDD
jgi:hypothetical protein